MFNIQQFFSRWKNKELDEILFHAAITDSIKETLKFELDPLLISYSNNTIFIKISPAAKSAILLKKNELIKKIQEKTKRNIMDIR
jgi:hypothetical protein